MRRIHILALSALASSVWLGGCGGGKAGPAALAPAATEPAGRGALTVSVQWPARSSRLVPYAAESLVVQVYENTTKLREVVLNRPTGGGFSSETVRELPDVTLNVSASAYPEANGQGTAQATGASTVTVVNGQETPLRLALSSTIATFTVSPASTGVEVGATATLVAEARNAAGEVVLVPATATWAVPSGAAFVSLPSSRAVASLTTTVTGVASGEATVQVSFDEASGATRTAQATVSVWLPGLPGPDGAAMRLIPAGTFTMGSPTGVGYDNERPQRTIHLDSYRIHQHEVTNAQYAAFLNARQPTISELSSWIELDAGTHQKIRNNSGTYSVVSGWEQHPVVHVSWYGAQAYAEHYGLLLPTEAQWEKAARGSSDARQYPWGDTWDRSRVNAEGTSGADTWGWDTSPVGSFPSGASPYGVLDMAGNVYEWCRDWYRDDWYAVMPDSNPVNDGNGSYRVTRGGSFDLSTSVNFRVSHRTYYIPPNASFYIGFRCVAAP